MTVKLRVGILTFKPTDTAHPKPGTLTDLNIRRPDVGRKPLPLMSKRTCKENVIQICIIIGYLAPAPGVITMGQYPTNCGAPATAPTPQQAAMIYHLFSQI